MILDQSPQGKQDSPHLHPVPLPVHGWLKSSPSNNQWKYQLFDSC